MNIAFVAFCAPRPADRTIGLFVHEMAKACVAAGHRVTVLVPVRVFPDTRLFRALLDPRRWRDVRRNLRAWTALWRGARGIVDHEGVRYCYTRYATLPRTNRAARDAAILTRRRRTWIAHCAATERPDVVVGHFLETAPLAGALAAGASAQWALYVHEDVTEFAARHGTAFTRASCRGPDALFANSRRTESQLRAASGRPDAVHVTHLGLTEEFLRSPSAAPFDGATFRLAYVSRFRPRKNHAVLLHAAAAWRDASPATPLALTLVGDDGPERGPMEELIRELHLDAEVRIAPATSLTAIRDVLLQSHGFFFPSHFESFGIVGLEAAALGMPLATGPDIGFTQDLAHAGWSIPTFDVESPVDCLRAMRDMLANYTQRRAEAAAIQAYVRTAFRWSTCVSAMLEHLAEPTIACPAESTDTDPVHSV